MNGKRKKLITAGLLLSVLIGTAACTKSDGTSADTKTSDTAPVSEEAAILPVPIVPDKPGGAEYVTDLSVSGIASVQPVLPQIPVTHIYSGENEVFSLQEADTAGDTVTLRASTVSALHIAQAYMDGTTASYQTQVQVTDIKESPWNALYFGLRLGSANADPTSQSGIWIALTCDEIGIRTGGWPETSYIALPQDVNFSEARMLYIEDDMKTDTVTVYADNDSGTRIEIAVIRIEDGAINLYAPDSETADQSDPILDRINGAGYANVWLHHTQTPATLTGFTSSGIDFIRATEEQANMMNTRDVFADTWVSTDDEGRETGTDNGAVSDKKVGIFYFLWHDGTSDQPIYDHSKAYAEGGVEQLQQVMTEGPLGFAHYWAEPYFGYYRSDDEWVIRRHTYQLNAAGVDFIFIDATNGMTYENNYETILKVWSEMRAEGYDTPQIMFHCGNEYNLAKSSLMALWNNLYSNGRYEELWFKHDGKPLILAPASLWADLPEEITSFFTCRQSWAYTKGQEGGWYTATDGNNCWPWADIYPQNPGKSADGSPEQMIVMSGFWVNGSFGTNAGRSYHNGQQPANKTDWDFGFSLVDETSGKGLAFEEQFDYAIEADPDIIMLTGWNEWWAGRWEGGAVGQKIANTYIATTNDPFTKNYYVDAFNPEFSRDIEPVKGYYNDNYYYQMTQNIRQYKGSRVNLPAFGQRAIDLDGGDAQWYAVGPEYRDYTGDITSRDADSYVGQLHYTNDSGRNDFSVCKVSRDGDDLYFYAQCADAITAPEGTNWMNLFINADGNADTGWYGYDYVLNRTQNGNTCSVMHFVNNSWETETVGSAELRVIADTIQIKVSASLLGIGDTFDFKWADNSVDDGDIMQFLDQGDCAPNDRFAYRYTTKAAEAAIPAVLHADMTVLKAGSYNAFAGGSMVMLDESSTKAVFFGDDEHWYVPKAFAQTIAGLSLDGAAEYNHFGTAYVDIRPLLAASDLLYTTNDSLLVIGAEDMTEEDLLTLSRALY